MRYRTRAGALQPSGSVACDTRTLLSSSSKRGSGCSLMIRISNCPGPDRKAGAAFADTDEQAEILALAQPVGQSPETAATSTPPSPSSQKRRRKNGAAIAARICVWRGSTHSWRVSRTRRLRGENWQKPKFIPPPASRRGDNFNRKALYQ